MASFDYLLKFVKTSHFELMRSSLRPPLEPYFFAFLRYAIKLSSHSQLQQFFLQLTILNESARECLDAWNDKRSEMGRFVYNYRSLIEGLGEEFFAVPKLQHLSLSSSIPKRNELVASFIDFLVETLAELLSPRMDFRAKVRARLKILMEELKLLLIFLGDTSFLRTEIEETVNVLTEIEAVANQVGTFLHSFFFTRKRDKLAKMDRLLSVSLPKFGMVKAKIKDHCIAVSKLPSCSTPNTSVVSLFNVDSLLDDLDDLPIRKHDIIAGVKDQITILHDNLMFSRSFLSDAQAEQLLEIKEIKECVLQLRDLAYEAEYIINRFVVGEVPDWYASLRLSDFIQKNELINAALAEFKLKIGIGNFEVSESPIGESSQAKSISMANDIDDIVVGLEDEEIAIASQLVGGPDHLQIISIFGMPGLGKTTLAKKLYNNSSVLYHFHKRSWCVVSDKYEKRKLLIDILSSISDKMNLSMEDERLGEYLYKNLKGRRYLIVMDDIWKVEAWDEIKIYFPDDSNRSRILFTSRLRDVALQASSDSIVNAVPFLSEDECWRLLQKKVFQNQCCPPELQDIGKKIATNCERLPLAIVVIAAVLANMEKKESLWQEVARCTSAYISADPNNCNNILELSYKHLPFELRPCFLYLSAFKEDTEISVENLLRLWIAEGFIHKKVEKSLEKVAEKNLMDLINRSLVQVTKRRSDGGVKAFIVHDLIHDLCVRIGKEENFLTVKEGDFGIYEQHYRVCDYLVMDFYHPKLTSQRSRPFGLQFRSLNASFSHPWSIFLSLKFLRVFILRSRPSDSSHLRGIELLFHLRYLKIPWLPPTIGRLENLEFLIAEYGDFISPVVLEMPKLKHLEIKASDCPEEFWSECCYVTKINNLQTLSCPLSCVIPERILRCSPHLRNLKCCFESHCPDLTFLTQLESLKMSRSTFEYKEIKFPTSIKKLTLLKTDFPWEKMSLIGTLPNLEILKLESFSFVGKTWNVEDDEFQKLKFLKLDKLGLSIWNASSEQFPLLQRLVLRKCISLKNIPSELGYIPMLMTIEAHDCGTNVSVSAMKIQDEQVDYGNEELKVIVSGSSVN